VKAKELYTHGESLFGKRKTLLSLWQEMADNFYPERADFTTKRVIGEEFASNLMTSYPILARRDLGNALGSMLRPTAKGWFHVRTNSEKAEDIDARRYLEWSEGLMRRAMYDKVTQFVRATKEGDHDFAAFGQCVLTVEKSRNADSLLYRCWHLRDVAWAENEQGAIGQVYRKWKPTVRTLLRLFPSKMSAKLKELASREPETEINCCHIVVESDLYDGTKKTPYTSIYYDVDNDIELEAVGIWNPMYVIPRWQTVSGSQYAYSPATVAALPDARLIQAMTLTLLEAGEKMTNPPMIAVQEAVRSDVAIYAGGITWVDADYDERLGEVLRPLSQDRSGMPIGRDMRNDTRDQIAEAFYLNKLAMPERAAEMTAFEVGQRVQEYIRQALPIFEPMEMEYNGAICEMTFDILMRAGAFGPMDAMPRSLRGAKIQFRFQSPLHDAIESEKEHKFLEMKALAADALAVDPTIINIVDVKTAFRDALLGTGVPATWQRTDAEAEEITAIQNKAAATNALLDTMQKGANVAATVGQASKALSERNAAAPAVQ